MSEVRSSSDYIFDSIMADAAPGIPRSMREQHGTLELAYAAASGMDAIGNYLKTIQLLQSGLIALAKQKALVDLALKSAPKLANEFKLDLNKIGADQKEAVKMLESEAAPLNAFALINLCTAFEVAVENTLIAAIRFKPGTIESLRTFGVSKIDVDEERDLTLEEALQVLGRLRNWAKTGAKAPDGFLRMLSAVRLSLTPSDNARRNLRAMIYLRNCILHRNSRADGAALDEAPHLGLVPGKVFRVGRADMLRFAQTALEFTSDLTQVCSHGHFSRRR